MTVMFKRIAIKASLLIMALMIVVPQASSQSIAQSYEDPVGDDMIRYDRYLDVEIWTNHSDGDFYIGDKVVIYFRANRDAFVVLYSVDSRGRVNMLFPTDAGQDNYVTGGVTYTLPGSDDDFDLVISGPEGVENIQAIASRERIEIPDWYPESGLVCDWDDRHEFMDWVNARYFARYEGQKFAFDRSALYINEWEQQYFEPVYYPVYPSWTVCGNVYIDYPFGASIYVDGIFWGVAPLYIPRLYVGWHTITVYDHWRHCWEHDFHVTRFSTVVFDRSIVQPQPNVMSKYKEVRFSGYRDPVTNGYPKFAERKSAIIASSATTSRGKIVVNDKTINVNNGTNDDNNIEFAGTKNYVRGTTKLVETDRGYETAGITTDASDARIGSQAKYSSSSKTRTKSSVYDVSTGTKYSTSRSSSRGYNSNDSENDYSTSGKSRISTSTRSYDSDSQERTRSSSSGSNSDGYYQKKSGSTSSKSSASKEKIQTRTTTKTTTKTSTPAVKSSGESTKTTKTSTDGNSGKTNSGGSKSKGGGKR